MPTPPRYCVAAPNPYYTPHSDDENNEHHLIPVSWVSEVKDDSVILNKTAEDVHKEWTTV